jgi:hypothetical protein
VLGSFAVIVVAAAVYLGVQQQWTKMLWLALTVAAVAVIIWAAVARPASGDEVVDMALRTRSVHVSAGLGAALAGVLAAHFLGFIGVLAWIAMSNTKPQRTMIKG